MEPLHTSDPRSVAGYHLVARLGAGGMGQVFLAFSPAGSLVALKVILPGLAQHEEFRVRFRREVRSAGSVRGPYVAEVLDADPDSDPPWLATQYVQGPSLADAVQRCGPLPPAAVTALGAATAEALGSVERAGLVHRDLKPSNVLLEVDGPRVIDFGIAKAAEASHLTRTGVLIGTPGFMAPEQIEGAALTTAADVFSLGAVLVFALTGSGPFGEGAPAALLGRVLYKDPDLTGVPSQWRQVLQECLARDPAGRPTLPALVNRLVPDGRPVADLFGPGWLSEPLHGYVQDRTVIADRYTASFQSSGGAGPDRRAAAPSTVIGSWPGSSLAGPGRYSTTGTATAVRRRRRYWPVLVALAALAAIAIPTVLTQLTRPEEGQEDQPPAAAAPESGQGEAEADQGGQPAGEAEFDALPERFTGVWTGTVHQSDIDTSYPVLVALGAGEIGSVVGAVRYWTLRCSGELHLDEVTAEHVLVTERITDGTENCTETVPLQLTLEAEDALRYHAYPGDSGSPRVDGPLGRSADRLPDRFIGTWEGTVHQHNSDQDYPVVATIDGGGSGTTVGSISYPSLECGGELRLEQTEGRVAWFTETITWDERALGCTSTGAVALSVTGDGGASFRWYSADDRYLSEPNVEGPVVRDGVGGGG